MEGNSQVAAAQQARVVGRMQPQRTEGDASKAALVHLLLVRRLLRPLPSHQDEQPRQLLTLARGRLCMESHLESRSAMRFQFPTVCTTDHRGGWLFAHNCAGQFMAPLFHFLEGTAARDICP